MMRAAGKPCSTFHFPIKELRYKSSGKNRKGLDAMEREQQMYISPCSMLHLRGKVICKPVGKFFKIWT